MSRFSEKVIKIVKMIPKGKVASYGQVSLMAGLPRGARMVGQILFREGPKEKDTFPWWRVINNAGRISIKNPDLAPQEQKLLLEKEGIIVAKDLTLDIEKYRWRPSPETLDKLKLDDEYVFKILEKYGI